MKVGDLVRHRSPTPGKRDTMEYPNAFGIVVGFDDDHDPVVCFAYRRDPAAFYLDDIEVIDESR